MEYLYPHLDLVGSGQFLTEWLAHGPAREVGALQEVPATFVKKNGQISEIAPNRYLVIGSQNKYAQRVYFIDGDDFYFRICIFL